jgi:S-adenosylmethionine decarboxylase
MGKFIRYIRWDSQFWLIPGRGFPLSSGGPSSLNISVESQQPMDALGRHVLIELWDCSPAINQPDAVADAIRQAVREIGATLLHLHVHAFSPQGVTGVAALAESHLALHSWPEHGYLAADVFTCGDHLEPLVLVEVLKQWFEPGCVEMKEIQRGRRPDMARCHPISPTFLRHTLR